MKPVMIWITVPDDRHARAITEVLLAEKLVACVSSVRGVHSRYWWKGACQTASEILLTAKTVNGNVPAIIRRVRALHAYEVPEVVAFPIVAGNPAYLRWIRSSVRITGSKRGERKTPERRGSPSARRGGSVK